MRKIQAHKVKLVSSWEDKRWNGAACEPCLGSKVCLSLRAAGNNQEIACYTRGQHTPQFSVLFSFTLLTVLDENGFVHTTMLNLLQLRSLCRPFSNKCLLKMAGMESHNHIASVLPTPTKSASSAWHPDITQPGSKKHTNLIWMFFLIMFYRAE